MAAGLRSVVYRLDGDNHYSSLKNILGPLPIAIGEADALKKRVDKLIKECNKTLNKSKLKDKEEKLKQLNKNCVGLKQEVTSLLERINHLDEEDEPSKIKDFTNKKNFESERLEPWQTQLAQTMTKLQETEDGYLREREAKKSQQVEEEDEEDEEEEEEEDEEEEEEEDDEEEDEELTQTARQFVAIETFKGEQEDDLDFKVGEVLTILVAREDGWWMAKNAVGQKGLVPSTYLKTHRGQTRTKLQPNEHEDDCLRETEAKKSQQVEVEDEEDEEVEEEEEEEEEEDKEEELTQTAQQFIAIHTYKGEKEGDLGFKVGEVLTILKHREDGWWMAKNAEGHKGLVPSTFLQTHLEQTKTKFQPNINEDGYLRKTEAKKSQQVEEEDEEDEEVEEEEDEEEEEEDDDDEELAQTARQFVAIETYDGEQEGDLNVEVGEVLTILKKREDGWWMAKNAEGQKGLVPSTFLQKHIKEKDEGPQQEEDAFIVHNNQIELVEVETKSVHCGIL